MTTAPATATAMLSRIGPGQQADSHTERARIGGSAPSIGEIPSGCAGLADTLSTLPNTDTFVPSPAMAAASDHSGDAPRAGLGGLWALFAGLALMMIGNGLNGAVIGVRSGTEGFSFIVTGVIMAGYFAGFLLAPSVVVRMVSSVGHIRVFAGLASTASSAVLVHAISVVPVTWAGMRFVFGFCMAGLYIVIESWLSEMSDATTRGRTLGIYMIVSMGGLGIGQYLIAFADPNGFRLFVLSSVLVSMSLVPVTLAATTKAPTMTLPERISIRELISIVPSGVLASFMSGAAAGILLGLGAVYATAIGLSLERTGFFLVAPTIGAILFQWPIGRLSDKVSRRSVMFGVALAASGVCVTLMVVPEQSIVVPLLMILLGGTLYPLYSLVISYTLDWAPPGKTVGASATLIRINGSGALTGPLVAAPLMAAFGERWFFWTMTIAFGTIVTYLAWRIAFKEALPVHRQTDFVPFPARAGSFAMALVLKPVKKATRLASGRQVSSRLHRQRAGDPLESPGGATPSVDDPPTI